MSNLLQRLTIGPEAAKLTGLSVHAAKTHQGTDVTVIRLEDREEHRAARVFEGIIRHGGCGGLEVEQADDEVVIASPSCAGTIAHLPSLGWRLSERLEVFKEVARIVENFHREGLCVGPLDPAFILLDDELLPFILGPRVVPSANPYAAPETAMSRKVDARSDIYSLGRLLHFVMLQDEPPALAGDPAPLDDLITFPAGLSRIVRKAVLRNPAQRYPTIPALLADLEQYGRYDQVGVAHTTTVEQNFGGMSYRPPRPVETVRPSTKRPLLGAPPAFEMPKVQPFKLRQGVRATLLFAGVLSVVGAFVVNYLAGDATWVRVLLSLAAGLVGFSLFSPGMDKEPTVRALFATFFALATFVLNPTPQLAKLAEMAGLHSQSQEERVGSFKSLSNRGVVEFAGIDLSGADLSNKLLYFAKLEGASLENANLSGTQFMGARLDGARFAGANLSGASFVASPVDYAVDFDQAICDEETKFPEGWACAEGHPAESRSTEKLSAK